MQMVNNGLPAIGNEVGKQQIWVPSKGKEIFIQELPPGIERSNFWRGGSWKKWKVSDRPFGNTQRSVDESKKVKVHTFWVQKETKVLKLDWNRLMVVSRSSARDDWISIAKAMK